MLQKMYEPPLSSMCWKGAMQQVPHWGSTVMQCPANLTVSWRCVFCAWKL